MLKLLLFLAALFATKGVLYVVAKGRNRSDSRHGGNRGGVDQTGKLSDGLSGGSGGFYNEFEPTPISH